MEFRVVVDIDRAARPTLAARSAAFMRGKGPETRFWAAFRTAEETAVSEAPASYEGTKIPAADMRPPEPLGTSVGAIHQQLRTGLPSRMHRLLIDRLAPRLDVAPQDVYLRMPASPIGVAAPQNDKVAALASLRIEIGEIRGGSLELLVIVFGFAKLATVAGITSEEFAGYIKIITPFALNVLYGTNVPLVGTAGPVGADDSPEAEEAATPTASGLRLVRQSSPYVILLVFVGFVLWLLVTSFDAESARLAAERKTILETVTKQETALAGERTAIAHHVAELSDSLLNTTGRREAALEKANRDLSAQQMALIVRLDAASAALDNAVMNFVKSRLSTPPAPTPTLPTSGCAPLTRETISGLQLALRVRHLYSDRIDGDFGPHSQGALVTFQRNAGLPATGRPDRETMELLGFDCEMPAR